MGKSYGEIFHEMFTMPNVQWPDVWQAILETLYMMLFLLYLLSSLV